MQCALPVVVVAGSHGEPGGAKLVRQKLRDPAVGVALADGVGSVRGMSVNAHALERAPSANRRETLSIGSCLAPR